MGFSNSTCQTWVRLGGFCLRLTVIKSPFRPMETNKISDSAHFNSILTSS